MKVGSKPRAPNEADYGNTANEVRITARIAATCLELHDLLNCYHMSYGKRTA